MSETSAESRAQRLVDAFRFSMPPTETLRFMNTEPLVESIASEITAAEARGAERMRARCVETARTGFNRLPGDIANALAALPAALPVEEGND